MCWFIPASCFSKKMHILGVSKVGSAGYRWIQVDTAGYKWIQVGRTPWSLLAMLVALFITHADPRGQQIYETLVPSVRGFDLRV